MSTRRYPKIRLPKYEEVDRTFPGLGIECLPGRIAALSHPYKNDGLVKTLDWERYFPDVATVVSSGVSWIRPGQIAVLMPDHGAFKEGWDERELRLIGVVRPWWHSLLGMLTEGGFCPAPGWSVVERGPRQKCSSILVLDEGFSSVGAIVAANPPDIEGQRVCIEGEQAFEFVGMPESHVLVWTRHIGKQELRKYEIHGKERELVG